MKSLCSYARTCSGCSSLQVAYPKQLRDKALRVRKALSSLVPNNPDSDVFADIAASPAPLGYRASTKLCLDEDKFGQRRIGLYQQQSKTVVDIPECPVHHPAINKLIAKLFSSRAPELPAPFYQHGKRGFQSERLKFLTVRYSPSNQAAAIILSHTGVDMTALKKWAAAHSDKKLSIYASQLNKADDTRIISADVQYLGGPARVPFAIGERYFDLSPLAFFQANYSLNGAFIKHIAGDLAGDVLVDLYGGFGAYSFEAAPGFSRTYLVDGNQDAIAAAKTQPHSPDNLVAVHASVEDFLMRHPGFNKDTPKVTHIIVNPPRTGISPKVSGFLANPTKLPRLRHLTYVSCNIDTLARDLKVLTKSGRWRLEQVKAFDMFPQTEHVEVVVKLKMG